MANNREKRGGLVRNVHAIECRERAIERNEESILRGIRREFHKEEKEIVEHSKEVEQFTFSDFAQSILGVGVWGISVLINPDIWIFTSKLNLNALLAMHLYFLISFMIVLYYQYHVSFTLNKSFFRDFLKRILFLYVSVLIGVLFLLYITNKLSFASSWDIIFHNFLIGQSVGLMGAVTFTFFKRAI